MWKILWIVITLILLANFCYDGRPLFYQFLPDIEKHLPEKVKNIVPDDMKQKKVRKKRSVEKRQKPEGMKVNSHPPAKKTPSKEVKTEFSKEDREKLNKIIENNAE